MIESLVTEADLDRLSHAREGAAGERARVRCKRRKCRGVIPPDLRADAVYCSVACKLVSGREERDRLRAEIRAASRALVPFCACGVPLEAVGRPGPVPRQCRRCRNRQWMRRYRAARKASVDGGEG